MARVDSILSDLSIRSYLRYEKIIDMISRRLTKIQKDEILEAYRAGENTNTLAEKYSCSANTINRTVKTLLSSDDYKLLKDKRSKSSKNKIKLLSAKSLDTKLEDLEEINTLNSPHLKINENIQSIKNEDDFYASDFEEIAFLPIEEHTKAELKNNDNSDLSKNNLDSENKFEEIVPLVSSFDFEKEELDFEILNQENLPECVYMIVDKKVELEVRSISDLPEWSFLPDNELQRNAILLFSNQRTAKRSCSRNQRVIKVPNTSVFEVSKSYLLEKGITRLILEDSIIALDN